MGSKNPDPIKKAKLSNAQNPMRPTNLMLPPMIFHDGLVAGSGGEGAKVFLPENCSFDCWHNPSTWYLDCSLFALDGGGGWRMGDIPTVEDRLDDAQSLGVPVKGFWRSPQVVPGESFGWPDLYAAFAILREEGSAVLPIDIPLPSSLPPRAIDPSSVLPVSRFPFFSEMG